MESGNMKREEKIQLASMIALFIFIALLVFTIVLLVKNINLLKDNPIDYGIQNSNLEICSCSSKTGQLYVFGGDASKTGDIWDKEKSFNS